MSRPSAIAHRMPSAPPQVDAWLAAGATRFECDVQLADDGQVVVSHYLPFLRVRGWFQHDGFHFRWGNGRLGRRDLTLAEALALLPERAGALLDPKETVGRRRADLIAALDEVVPTGTVRRARFAVSTADERDLAGYRSAGFTTWRTIGDTASLRAFLDGRGTSHDGLSIRHTLLDRITVDRLHESVPTVVAWTVNDDRRAAALVEWGVDGVTTDRPEIAGLVTGNPGNG